MKLSEKMQEVAYGWDEQVRSGAQSPILHAAATRMRMEADEVAALEARLSKMEESKRVAIKIIALARSLADQPTWIERLEETLTEEEA